MLAVADEGCGIIIRPKCCYECGASRNYLISFSMCCYLGVMNDKN